MYTTASGIQIPQGTDAFSPTSQFKVWGDGAAAFENHLIRATYSDMNALAAPVLKVGLVVYVTADTCEYVYLGGSWIPLTPLTGVVQMTLNNVNSVTVNITFPAGRFTASPLVFAGLQTSPGTARKLNVQAAVGSATTAAIVLSTGDGTNVTLGPLPVAWQAIQPVA